LREEERGRKKEGGRKREEERGKKKEGGRKREKERGRKKEGGKVNLPGFDGGSDLTRGRLSCACTSEVRQGDP
jgi:hypothetical protein